MNYATRFLYLLIVFELISAQYCSASHIQVQTDVKDFLFSYFGISPLLKQLPRDVQFLIARHLRNFFRADCFVMEKPHKLVLYERGLPSCDNHLRALAFSQDNMNLVFCTETVCRLVNINDNGKSIAHPHVIHKLDKGNYLDSVACNESASRILIFGSNVHEPWDSGVSFFIELFLKNNKVVWQRSPRCPDYFDICAVCYTPNGEIIGATKKRSLFVLNKRGVCVVYHKDPDTDTLMEYDSICGAYIFPHKSRVLFQTESYSGGSSGFPYRSFVISCDYRSGEYTYLVKCVNVSKHDFSVSSSLNVISLQMEKPSTWRRMENRLSIALLTDTGGLIDELRLPGERITYLLSPDGEYILFIPPYMRATEKQWDDHCKQFLPYLKYVFIWHVPSKRVIAYINAKVTTDLYSKIRFSNDGAFFAHAHLTDERFFEKLVENKEQPNVIGIWKINPLWKELKPLYEGNLLIEQALFMLFLRIVRQQGTSSFNKNLFEVARKANISFDALRNYLQTVYSSLETPIQGYVVFFIGSY